MAVLPSDPHPSTFRLVAHYSARSHQNKDSKRRSSAVGWLRIEVDLRRVSKGKGGANRVHARQGSRITDRTVGLGDFAPVHSFPSPFDTSLPPDAYDRYEFPRPPRVCRHAEDEPQDDSQPGLQFTYPLPYGAVLRDGGVQFVVFSRSATAMRVLLYDAVNDREPSRVDRVQPQHRPLGRHLERVRSRTSKAGQLYHFQADGPFDPSEGQRFDPQARLIDPYARALAGEFLPADDGIIRPPKCVVVDDHFDWQGDRHLQRPLSEIDHLRDARPRLHAERHRARSSIRARTWA